MAVIFTANRHIPRTTLATYAGVKQRDFFAYCTSLTLLELKAIGSLSQVRHYREGDRIYSAGEEANEFYVINRGIAELVPERAMTGVPATVLSRGDLFGATGALMNLPRVHSAMARAELSVQCFRRSVFPDLVQKVPSFFLFISEKLANRLFQANELGRSHTADLELTGSFANFDVVTIYQTILHSKQTGLLSVSNDEGEKISEFFFERGAPRWGHFEHLRGEESFWQLFLHDDHNAKFSFANGMARREPGAKGGTISRQGDEILISAIHMRDEFDELRNRLIDPAAVLQRKGADLRWDDLSMDSLRPAAEAIWQVIYDRPISLSDLYRECRFCGLKIYKVVDEMVRNELVTLETSQRERLAGLALT